jgi:hypothetical protein
MVMTGMVVLVMLLLISPEFALVFLIVEVVWVSAIYHTMRRDIARAKDTLCSRQILSTEGLTIESTSGIWSHIPWNSITRASLKESRIVLLKGRYRLHVEMDDLSQSQQEALVGLLRRLTVLPDINK